MAERRSRPGAAARCASGVRGTEAASSPIRSRARSPSWRPEPLILEGVGCRDRLAGQVRAADDQIGEHAR